MLTFAKTDMVAKVGPDAYCICIYEINACWWIVTQRGDATMPLRGRFPA